MKRSFNDSRLATHLRVLFALIMREMSTRYGRSAGGYIWAILEPAGTIALLALVFAQVTRHPPLGGSFLLFFASGYLSFHIYMDITRAVSASVKVNKGLLTFPRVTMLDTIIARFLLQFLTMLSVFTILMSLIAEYAEYSLQINLKSILLSIAMNAVLGLGVGVVNCVLFAFMPTWERIFSVVNRPMLLISGVLYVFESLPRPIQEILWWNPLIHATATMRAGFYPYYVPSFVSPGFVFTVGLGLLATGILLLRTFRSQMLEKA
jgi:capsular polysaccharide transport system permease protein